jgi:hypothetical protein
MLEKPYEIHILDGSILKISEFYSAPVIHGTARTALFFCEAMGGSSTSRRTQRSGFPKRIHLWPNTLW